LAVDGKIFDEKISRQAKFEVAPDPTNQLSRDSDLYHFENFAVDPG
jgi:hypothetical protein